MYTTALSLIRHNGGNMQSWGDAEQFSIKLHGT